jgi:predicted N-formylglutamate amidohydrolase
VAHVTGASPLVRGNQFVVSCEHASNRIPGRYDNLGLAPKVLESHIAWDAGARVIAAKCAKALGCPFFAGRYSRLLIDLNRSPHHPKLAAKESFGIRIPSNANISRQELAHRIDSFYSPYRAQVIEAIRGIIARAGCCIHLGIHSFTPRVRGVERRADIGLLFDPRSSVESAFVRKLAEELRAAGYHVRRNYPYRGTSDGLTTHCRRLFQDGEYAGIEIEANLKLVSDAQKTAALARDIIKALLRISER